MSGRLFGNNNNSSSSSRGKQQIVNKRNAIKFGTDELRNLDAVANDDDEETVPQSQSYEQMMQKIGNRRNHNNHSNRTKQRTDETTTSSSPSNKKNQRQKNSTKNSNKKDESDVEEAEEEDPTKCQQEQAALKPPYTPPEARLARWTFVFRNLFPTFLAPHTSVSTNMKKLRNQNRQKTTLMIEALERIDRWKRVTASHGLMMRLRKVPAYIDATKPLVEAIQMDRHLQEMREDLWRSSSSTLNEKVEEEEEDDKENNEEENDNDQDQESDAEEEEETTTKQQQQPSAASSPLHALLLQFPHNGTNNNNNQQQQALHQQITASTLPMVYASAISRAVFELTESQKKYSDQLDSKSTFRQRAQDIALPEELAEARNQIAHGRMPTLAQLRFAASLGLQYLHDFFWIPRSNVLKEYRVAKEEYEKNIKNESGKNTVVKGSNDSSSENVASSSSVSAGKFGMRRQREVNQKQQNNNNNSASATVPPAKKMMSLEEMKAKMQAMKK